mmetsp:Transcript_45252/g.69290  ORF Transcript_45252/g.69290 Transcript_45252/m.69290 type:complete len:101 (+) Transcript_45252:61-363(+)
MIECEKFANKMENLKLLFSAILQSSKKQFPDKKFLFSLDFKETIDEISFWSYFLVFTVKQRDKNPIGKIKLEGNMDLKNVVRLVAKITIGGKGESRIFDK